MRKNWGTWLLLGFTVLVVAYAYFFEFQKRKKDEKSKELEERVIKLEKDQINKITITSTEKFELQKNGDAWRIVSPVQDDADTLQVGQFLDSVLKEKADMEITEDVLEPKMYGLEKPRAVLEFSTSSRTHTKVEIGDEAIQGKHYLRRDSSNDIIVSSNQWQVISAKNLKDFRSKDLVRHAQVESVEVDLPGKPKFLIEEKNGQWLVEGQKFKPDVPAIKAFITQIQNLRGQDVAAEDQKQLEKFGLDKPVVILRAKTKDGKDPLVIRISGPRNKNTDSFLTVSSLKPVYKSYAGLPESFTRKPSDFRDREGPFEFDLSQVIGIRTKNLHLIKKGEAWYLEKPDPKVDVDQVQLMQLITALQGSRVREYLGKIPFQSTDYIELLDKDGNVLLKIELGDEIKAKGRRSVKTTKSEEIFSVDNVMADSWSTKNLVRAKVNAK